MKTLTERYEELSQRYPSYSYEEEAIVAAKAARGDKIAFEALLNHNAGRILFFARRAAHGTRGPESNVFDYTKNSINMDDAICIALQGLMKAIRTFNPDRYGEVHKGKKVRFSSWANLLIKRDLINFGAKEHRRIKKESKFPLSERNGSLIIPSPEVGLAKERFWEIVAQTPRWCQDIIEHTIEKGTRDNPKPSPKKLDSALEELLKVASEEELRSLWKIIAQ